MESLLKPFVHYSVFRERRRQYPLRGTPPREGEGDRNTPKHEH